MLCMCIAHRQADMFTTLPTALDRQTWQHLTKVRYVLRQILHYRILARCYGLVRQIDTPVMYRKKYNSDKYCIIVTYSVNLPSQGTVIRMHLKGGRAHVPFCNYIDSKFLTFIACQAGLKQLNTETLVLPLPGNTLQTCVF